MSFLEVLALAILFFNMGYNEPEGWQKYEQRNALLRCEKYRVCPYAKTIDDDLLECLNR